MGWMKGPKRNRSQGFYFERIEGCICHQLEMGRSITSGGTGGQEIVDSISDGFELILSLRYSRGDLK